MSAAVGGSITNVEALSADNITTVGVVVILALVVIGVVLSALITAIVARIVIALVVVVLAIVVWQQRGHVQDRVNERVCSTDTTFFGVHVDQPDSVRRVCDRRVAN